MQRALNRRFRWLGAPLLVSAAFYGVSFLPSTMAHEGKVSLELSGLQNVYEESDLVSGAVTVHSTTDLENPQVRIQISDPDCAGKTCGPAYDQTFKVRFDDDDRKGDRRGNDDDGDGDDHSSPPIPFRLKRSLPVSAYTVEATLTVGREGRGRDRDTDRASNRRNGDDDGGRVRSIVAVKSARLGVRQLEMRGMPDTILKGDVTAVDVDSTRKLLREGAASGKPVQLKFGSAAVTVRVEEREVLAQGVTIPKMGRPTMYFGKVIKETAADGTTIEDAGARGTDTGEEDPDSFVTLTAVGESINGIIARGRATGKPDESRSVMHIDAKKNYRGEEASDQHMVYDHRHTFPPPGLRPGDGESHHEGPFSPNDAALAWRQVGPLGRMARYLGGLLMPPALAQTPPTSRSYTVNVHVYEHDTGVEWTQNRWTMVNNALARLLEIQNFNPVKTDAYEIDPTRLVSVSGYLITGWSKIANQNGYSSTRCADNFSQFQRDIPQAEDNTIHLFLTDFGNRVISDAAGCADQVSSTYGLKRYAVVMDDTFYSWSYGAIITAQEIGHALDEHPNWSNCPGATCVPHDPHTSRDISQTWNDGDSCTIMSASYGSCDDEYLEYQHSVGGTSALFHLASGVRTIFKPDPMWTALPPLPNGDRATDIGIGGGQTWVIGGTNVDAAGNRHIYRWDSVGNQWQQNGGNSSSTLRSAVRVAVDANGRPWVVTAAGAVFSKDASDVADLNYTLRPAPAPGRGASDIAVGLGSGDVWIIGNDFNAAGNASIYNFQPTLNNWSQGAGRAKRITLQGSAEIWVNTADGALYRIDASGLVGQPGSGVHDIAGNGAGTILATAPLPGHSYRFVNGSWTLIPRPAGGGVAIAATAGNPALGTPGDAWLVDTSGRVWSSAP